MFDEFHVVIFDCADTGDVPLVRFATFERRGLDGVKPYPSKANFILFELVGADPKAVFEALYADGVLIRDVTSYPRLGRALRVTVGNPAENDAFLTSLGRALSEGIGGTA